MLYYRRRLPHWIPDSSILFITWRLAGSLPAPRADLPMPQHGAPMSFVQRALRYGETPHNLYFLWVCTTKELNELIRYVENNPVQAGLVADEAQWPWSSARMRADDALPEADDELRSSAPQSRIAATKDQWSAQSCAPRRQSCRRDRRHCSPGGLLHVRRIVAEGKDSTVL